MYIQFEIFQILSRISDTLPFDAIEKKSKR